jgi:fatty-acid desaturase
MAWWQIDISGYIIRLLEILHLVKNVYRVPNAVMQEKLISEK